MRVGFPGGPRLEWYDRNALKQSTSGSVGATGPHAQTSRASYTVPTGKKALIGSVYGDLIRYTVATTVGLAGIIIAIVADTLLNCQHRRNAAGDQQTVVTSPTFALYAGQTIEFFTIDASTGGTCRYDYGAGVTEFDA